MFLKKGIFSFKFLKMTHYLALFAFSILILTSCVEEKNNSVDTDLSDLENIADLKNQINQLKLDSELKDSILNESISFFNEIQRNLAAIGLKKDEIRVQSSNQEVNSFDKNLILEEINYINFLRTENSKKVHILQEKLQSSNLKTNQLQEMLGRLTEEIQRKDSEIEMLQKELEQKDQEYSKLFDAYLEQVTQKEEIQTIMNTVYYAYGTSKELKENHVITESKGFIGMGKKAVLKENFNENYFTAIQIKNKKEFVLEGKNPKIITDHPIHSFQLLPNGNKTILKILDVNQFWKVSKYLVVVVE
jgi:DNA repair exonuclease SbcCD ATPase subunit